MIFTSKNASDNANNTVFTTHVKIAIYQFLYFTPTLPKEFHPHLKIWTCPSMYQIMFSLG